MDIKAPESVEPADLVTIAKLAAEAPDAFTEQKLRWLVFNAESNGLAPAIVRINNRVFLHRPTLSKWLAKGNQKNRGF